MLKNGQKAPDFRLQDDTGREVSLKDFKGKKWVLYFYPKDNTPGCTQEACDFRDNLSRLKKFNIAVYGVSRDSIESHKKFREKYGLSFPLLSDPETRLAEAYGAWGEKNMYGRKTLGIIRSTFLIDENGIIEKIWSPVKVNGHVSAVLEYLGANR